MQTEDELDPLFCEPLAFDETALCSKQLNALKYSSLLVVNPLPRPA